MLFSACAGTKHLPEGEILYSSSQIAFSPKENFNKRKKLGGELLAKAMPKPNKKILGFFKLRLWLYNHVTPKKEKGFRYWLKNKVGEEPVLSEESLYNNTAVLMKQHLHEHGYFQSSVDYTVQVKKRKAIVTYKLSSKGQYSINNIYLPQDAGHISKTIRAHQKDLVLNPGDAYDEDKLSEGRNKMATFIRSMGYYDFSKQFIYYYVDTALNGLKLDVYFRVKDQTDTSEHKKYYINDITVYPVYSIDDTIHSSGYDTIFRRGYTIIQPELFLKSRAISRNILINKGELFSHRDHNYTVNHFLELGIFKFVNLKYEKVGDDSLDVIIQLTPSNTQNVEGELNVSTTTTNFLGLGASASYIHRNIFKGAEKLTIGASVNSETQFKSAGTFLHSIEVIARAEIGIPRLLIPFGSRKISTYYVPRTNFSISESFQKRIEYYTLNSLLLEYAYDWRRNIKIRHIVTPLSINQVRLFNSTLEFDDILAGNSTLRAGFESTIIVAMQYSYIYTGKGAGDKISNYGYFRGNLDLAGNVIYAIGQAVKKNSIDYELFGRPVANYTKWDIDGRYYLRMTRFHSYVNRIIFGTGIPYGNSDVMPYVKQFYSGGATSVRAYRFRSLGPGSYDYRDDTETEFPDQTGNIKLEFNTEYRFDIFRYLKGALFADAGNIWLLKDDPEKPGGKFEFSKFYKEIAIGVGFGLRLDFDFFVIRLDASVPLRRPDLPEGDRWTFDKFNFGNKDWRHDNLIWNFAIGYPF